MSTMLTDKFANWKEHATQWIIHVFNISDWEGKNSKSGTHTIFVQHPYELSSILRYSYDEIIRG